MSDLRHRTAFYPGTCRICGARFAKGDQIVYQGFYPRGQKCSHAGCFDKRDVAADRRAQEEAAAARAEQERAEASASAAEAQADEQDQATASEAVQAEAEEEKAEVEEQETRHPAYERLRRWVNAGVTRIWITGAAGTGKTYACEQLAREMGVPIYIMTPIESRYDALGYNDAHGRYVETPIYRWAVDPNPRAMLVLDEVDGFQPGAMISINAIMANGLGVFPHAQIPIAPTKIIVGTANTIGDGPDVKYSGRLAQDASVVDRFAGWLPWGVDEQVERRIALAKTPAATTERAVNASQAVRAVLLARKIDLDWGPRRTYAVAALRAAGETLREAVLVAGLLRLPEHLDVLREAGLY